MPGVRRLMLPTPYAVGPVNAYVVTGEEPTLIDVGPATPEAADALVSQLGQVGLTLANIRRVIITHAHPDHYGALALLGQVNWEVAVHPLASLWMAGGEDSLEARVSFYVGFLRQCGLPGELLRASQRDGLGLRDYPRGIPVHRFLQEGDVVRAGDHLLRVHYTPGHASSAICLLGSGGLLFSGDTLLAHISSNALVEPVGSWRDGRRRSLPEYLASLVRLQNLPLKKVLPGHGDEIEGHGQLIAERLRFYRERRDRILGFIQAEVTTVYELCLRLFPSLKAEQLFLGLSETVGYLDLLEADGLIVADATGPVTTYRRPELHG